MKRHKRLLQIVLSLCFLGMLSPASPAKTGDTSSDKPFFSVEAQVDRSSITIGDPIVYLLTVRRHPKSELMTALQIPSSADFEITRVEDFKRGEDGWTVEGKKVTLTSFRLGEFVLDPISVTVKNAQGRTETLESPPIYITVVSSQTGPPETDIRGIKSVVDIPWRFIKKYAAILIAAILLLTAFFLIRQRFKKLQGEVIQPRQIRSPEDEAFSELHTLFDSALLRQGKTKEYFLKMSEILRVYFEKHYLIFAIEATTGEILRLLRQKDVSSELAAQTREVLEMCDLAKFAKWKPDPIEILKINQMAEDVIKKAAAERSGDRHGV